MPDLRMFSPGFMSAKEKINSLRMLKVVHHFTGLKLLKPNTHYAASIIFESN